MEIRSTAYFTVIPEKKTGSCIEVRLNSPLVKFKITNMADVNNSSDQSTFYYNFTQKSNFVKEQVKKEKTRTNMEMTPLLQDDLNVIEEDHALVSQDLPNVRRKCLYYYVS